MAGKQYTMEMVLGAVMASSFSGTMTKAQQEFARLGNEIKTLNQTQSDISAWQKQQQAVQNTAAKLDNYRARLETLNTRIQKNAETQSILEQQLQKVDQEMATASGPALEQLSEKHDKLQKELNETVSESAKLEDQKLRLQQTIQNTENALGRQEDKLKSTSERLREAGVDTNNLTEEEARLAAQTQELRERQEQVGQSARTFGQQFSQAMADAGEALAAAGVLEGLSELKDAFVACVSIAAEFESTMSTVEALSGATAEEMSELSAAAKEVGATTSFTATEAAESLTYMGMAGYDASEMLGALPGVINLSLASGEALAETSDIVTDALTAFGLTAADASHFADILAATATNSNTNVAKMGETFKYAAPLAGALGYSVEDVATMIGLMANNGIKANQAGTALRTMFTKLIDGATITSDNFGEVTVATQNTDGSMRTLSETVSDLRYYFNQMTDAEKLMNAESLVGKYAMSGFVSLMNSSQDDFDTLSAKINDCAGSAQDMADIKMDNLTGDLALLSSAWDAVKTSIGEQYIPAGREAATVTANILTGVNEFINEYPGVVKGIGAAAVVIGTVSAAIAGYTAVTKVAAAATKLFTGSLGSIAIATVAIAALVGAVAAFSEETENYTALAEEQQEHLEELNLQLEGAVDEYGENSVEAARLRTSIAELNDEIANTPQTIDEAVGEYDTLIESIQETRDAYDETLSGINDQTLDARALAVQVKDLASGYSIATGSADALGVAIDALNNKYPGLDLTKEEVLVNNSDWVERVNAAIEEENHQNEVNAALSRRTELMEQQSSLQAQIAAKQAQVDAANRKKTEAGDTLHQISDSGMSQGYEAPSMAPGYEGAAQAYQNASEEAATFQSELDTLNGELETNQNELEGVNEVLGMTEEQLDYAASAQGQLESAVSDASSSLAALKTEYSEALSAAVEAFEGQFALWEEAPTIMATSIANLQQASQSRETYWTTYADDLEYLLGLSPDVEGLGPILAQLSDGSEDSANAVAGLAQAARNGTDDLQAYIDQMNEEQDALDRVETIAAQAAIDMPGELQKINDTFDQTISDLDLSEEAATNADATLQALIDEAEDYITPIKNAYQQVGNAMIAGINAAISNATITAPSVNWGTQQGYSSVSGYASGTDSAPPGWAWVGEEGPELIHMQGGETVLTNSLSEQFARQYSDPFWNELHAYADGTNDTGNQNQTIPLISASNIPPVQINIQVNGNATPDTVESLKDAADEIAERVWDRIQDRTEDAARKKWS